MEEEERLDTNSTIRAEPGRPGPSCDSVGLAILVRLAPSLKDARAPYFTVSQGSAPDSTAGNPGYRLLYDQSGAEPMPSELTRSSMLLRASSARLQ